MASILADDTFKCLFLNENDRIPIRISLKFVPRSPIDNDKPALVQVHWCIYAALGGDDLTPWMLKCYEETKRNEIFALVITLTVNTSLEVGEIRH